MKTLDSERIKSWLPLTCILLVLAGAAAPALAQGRGAGRGQGWRGGWGRGATRPTTQPVDAQTPATQPARGFGMGRGMGPPEFMRLIHTLLDDHLKIKRTVEDVPGGVVTVTTSEDPRVAENIRTHVKQMKQRMADGLPVRPWDPLFVEMLRQRDKMKLQTEDVPGGIKVTHTSDDAAVTGLIRQHARRGVSEFVAEGWNRVHQETPLPEARR